MNERIPYVDRPEIRAAWCSCPTDNEGERERWFTESTDTNGLTWRTHRPLTDPLCPLHGLNAKGAPF